MLGKLNGDKLRNVYLLLYMILLICISSNGNVLLGEEWKKGVIILYVIGIFYLLYVFVCIIKLK